MKSDQNSSINDTIKNDDSLSKWLKYGFWYLTGINPKSFNIEEITSYLKYRFGYTDNDILRLCDATYTASPNGRIVRLA